MLTYLSFGEVASRLGCETKKVRQLVLEDKSLRATRITPNGLVLTECGLEGHFPYDLDFNCHLCSEGEITSDIYRIGASGKTEKTQTLFVGYLRVEYSELQRFISHPDFVSLSSQSLPSMLIDSSTAQDSTMPTSLVDTVEPNKAGDVVNWKMKVQVEATALCLRLRDSGANPTPHSILSTMAKWCRTTDVKTDSGIHPSEGYLRTHVLGGKHWNMPN